MIETICKDCGARYQLGQDHTCQKRSSKKSASAVKPAALPRMTDRSGESRKVRAQQVNESTAARKDVHGSVRMTPASAPQPEPQDRIGGLGNDPQVVILAAGTQAPPVDTHKRGRPRIHPDRKAYKAEHERKRRANKKAKEAAK